MLDTLPCSRPAWDRWCASSAPHEVLGIIPFVGAEFETDEVRGLVTQMEKRRVVQVRVWKKDNPDAEAADED